MRKFFAFFAFNFKKTFQKLLMRREYLEPICKERAEIIFQEALDLYSHPLTRDGVNRMQEYCYERLKGFNHIERALIEEHLKKLLRAYLSELHDYNTMYR